jgi:hypothetical protein
MKRFPGMSDGDRSKKFAKRAANRRVRHEPRAGNFGNYKKLYEQWDICDHNFRMYSLRETWEHMDEWYGFAGLKGIFPKNDGYTLERLAANHHLVVQKFWRYVSK